MSDENDVESVLKRFEIVVAFLRRMARERCWCEPSDGSSEGRDYVCHAHRAEEVLRRIRA